MAFGNPSSSPRLVILLGFIMICYTLHPRPPGVLATVRNMFEYQASLPYLGTAWASYCYSQSDYIPTCGWTIILTSSEPLIMISVYTGTTSKINDYTFHVSPMFYNTDITSFLSNCDTIEIRGTFGNDAPDVTMSYYCVCTTGPDCEPVPYLSTTGVVGLVTSPPTSRSTAAPPATTAATTTAAAITTTTPLTPGSTSSPSSNSTEPTSSSTKLRLQKVYDDKCYSGPWTKTTKGQTLDYCGVACLSRDSCTGMNFVTGGGGSNPWPCTLVLVDTWDNSDFAASTASGCQFWKVVGRD